MSEPIVIVHGWSDKSASFVRLAAFLKRHLGTAPTAIDLADWVSMEDDISYADLAEGMQRAWRAHGLPTGPRTVNVVVHSTGALVTREWMTRHFTPATVPIRRLLMLAPANFGSPLAHKGRSFLGRAVKGWGNEGFETGRELLKGLELASPYTWGLAERDLFVATPWYGAGGILATVLVGNEGYGGLRAIANETGSDGTVRISTANLNALKIEVRLDQAQTPVQPTLQVSNGAIGFGIVAGANHGSITLGEVRRPDPANPLERLILRALTVSDADYAVTGTSFPWQQEIERVTGATATTSARMQTAVLRVRDNLGNAVRDYFVEFYRTADTDHAFEQALYTRVLRSVHPYDDDPSYRALYLDVAELAALRAVRDTAIQQLFISVMAQPVYLERTRRSQPVGYAPVSESRSGGIKLTRKQMDVVFQPHRTALIDIELTRQLSDEVFRLKSA
jgi:pimeloyl-ACP methyl ester carboxylesterase